MHKRLFRSPNMLFCAFALSVHRRGMMAQAQTISPESEENAVPNQQPITVVPENCMNDIKEFWKKLQGNEMVWYKRGNDYWSGVTLDNDGVMGGYGQLHAVDIACSEKFIQQLYSLQLLGGGTRTAMQTHCLDVGAGIGRISGALLMRYFGLVDLIEQNEKLAETAFEQLKRNPRLGKVACCGLQTFKFAPSIAEDVSKQYDCIWIQWVCNQLTDDDVVRFLQECRATLKKDVSVIVVKENISEKVYEVDFKDCSITRTAEQFRTLFISAGYTVVLEGDQDGFPEELYKVKLFALKPQ